jgi:thaumarchaeosortase
MEEHIGLFRKLLPILALAVPIVLLYALYPKSFEGDATWEGTWQGRFFYIFFLWIISLETIWNWEMLKKNRTTTLEKFIYAQIGLGYVSMLPTIYVIAANFHGLNTLIASLAKQQGVYWSNLMPLSAEYFAFAALFVAIILLIYGRRGIKNYLVSAVFPVIIGALYVVDDMYPFGRFTPFQLIVQPTAYLATGALNLMGYHTRWLGNLNNMPTYLAWDVHGNYSLSFSIAWPCAGVESLVIYTAIILLFLRRSDISRWSKVAYFVIGAVVTYVINILRIVSIYLVSMNHGDWLQFHNIYGPLYSISWIISYPLIIIGSQLLWSRIKTRRERTKNRVEPLLSQRSLDSLG